MTARGRWTGRPTRPWAQAGAALAVIAVPTVGSLLESGGEDTRQYDTVVTPPDYAFVVWAPIFAGIAVDAVDGCRAGRGESPDHRVSAWPLTVAYLLNTGWSVAAQTGRFGLTPVLLPAAAASTAVALARLQRVGGGDAGTESTTTVAAGALLGWTALASTVNVSAATQLLGVDARARTTVAGSVVGVVATSLGLTRLVARSRRGGRSVAATAAWGLLTTAGDRRRPPLVRLGAALGAASVVGAASRLRTPAPRPPR